MSLELNAPEATHWHYQYLACSSVGAAVLQLVHCRSVDMCALILVLHHYPSLVSWVPLKVRSL